MLKLREYAAGWWPPPERRWLRVGLRLAPVAVVAGAIILALLLSDALEARQAGYGVVAVSVLVASGGLVIPVPALATACAAAGFLNPLAVALIAAAAGTLGETTGYLLGCSGRGALDGSRLYRRVEEWLRRRGGLALFVIAAVPNPIFDLAGIAAGAMRYPLRRYLLVVGMGKLVKFLALAYACALSIHWLQRLLAL